MKNKEVYTDEEMLDLLNEIRQNEPKLSNSEETLETIVKSLPDKPLSVPKMHLSWWKTISHVAAVFLIGLFVFQQVKDYSKTNNITENKPITAVFSSKKTDKCSFTDQYARLHPREVLLCYVKTNTRKPNLYEKLKNNLQK